MPLDDYNKRAIAQHRAISPNYHTSECLSNSVDAFCDDRPDPGCICGAEAEIEQCSDCPRINQSGTLCCQDF